MSAPVWNPAAQLHLLTQLQGFWAADLWDMHHSPAGLLLPSASQRWLRFGCKSPSINGELKYVCSRKFQDGEWRGTQVLTKMHLLIRWLNSMEELPPSLLSYGYEAWRESYRGYLVEIGMYKPGVTSRMTKTQQTCDTPRDSQYMSTLRQISRALKEGYDTRPEKEKDVWNLRSMGVATNLSQSNARLSFLVIRQEWLREAVKSYLSYCLPLFSSSTCRTRVQSIACFSEFLEVEMPEVQPGSITRALLLEYLGYLQAKISPATAKNHILNLRNFLEMSHRQGWMMTRSERMLYDEEVPRPAKPQPRFLPSAVLDQLNSHLSELSAPWRRMILILEECGMRISELLQLRADCLTQDARGVPYLRYMQEKVRRENAIPVSRETACLVQEQQAELSAQGKLSELLFPNAKGGVRKQATFANLINRLAYDHDIRDSTGKLFRFQSHQFRHTVGTRMVNLGVPHHIIQRYLGHTGPEMTSRYAHIHDTTMRDKLAEYLKSSLVDVTGRTVVQEGANDNSDLQWFTRNILAQALTNGYCAIPTVAGPCPHPNACLNCAHFRTDATFLEVHRAELRDTEQILAKARENGWIRQLEMNQRKQTSLVNIVTALEAAHD